MFRKSYAALLMALPLVAQAAPVPLFDNFSAGNAFSTTSSWTVGGPGNFIPAMAFTPGVSASLDGLLLAIGYGVNSSAPVTIAVRSDSGDLPGAILESFTVASSAFAQENGSLFAPLALASVTHPLLTAGSQYWISASVSAGDLYGWNLNTSGDNATGNKATSFDGGSTWTASTTGIRGAFSLTGDVTPVPLPASAWLLLTGLAGMVLVGRRRSLPAP